MRNLLEKRDNVCIQEGYLTKESDGSHYCLLSNNTLDSYSNLLTAYHMMIYNTPFYDIFHYPEYSDDLGNELMVYAPRIYFSHIDKIVRGLMEGKINFDTTDKRRNLSTTKYEDASSSSPCCWYETRNNFMFFFGELAKELLLDKIDEDCLKMDYEEEDIISLSLAYLEEAPVDQDAIKFLMSKLPILAKRMTQKDYRRFKERHGFVFRENNHQN